MQASKPRLVLKNGKIKVEYPIDLLQRSFIGQKTEKGYLVNEIEAYFLMEIRDAILFENNKQIFLDDFLKKFYKKDFFVKYNVFRDWKERGLFLTFPERFKLNKNFGKSPVKKYPCEIQTFNFKDIKAFFLPEELISISFGYKAKELFEKYWIGQWGVYKNIGKGKSLKLDIFETLFIAKHGGKIVDINTDESYDFNTLLKKIDKSFPQVKPMYEVYEDWRTKGFILKTGFKFGTHFRIYFPGASPLKKGREWVHSQHVIHVFPKDVSMRMAEWARAVRVAHSVRKTFIMAIPEMKEEDYMKEKTPFSFIAWHRDKNNNVEKPDKEPSFIIITLEEDEELSGKMLASALDFADRVGLRLLIAISDRETSVTYYVANRIELPNSKNKYYEIEWFTP